MTPPIQRPVPHVPPDSAEYLEGPLPQYQSGGQWEVDGKTCDMNNLPNPFDNEDYEPQS